jgi:hypothetical protein
LLDGLPPDKSSKLLARLMKVCGDTSAVAEGGDDAADTAWFVMPAGLHRSYFTHHLHFIACSCRRIIVPTRAQQTRKSGASDHRWPSFLSFCFPFRTWSALFVRFLLVRAQCCLYLRFSGLSKTGDVCDCHSRLGALPNPIP